MNKKIILLALTALLVGPLSAQAEDEIANAETEITTDSTQSDYIDRIKSKYNLTDEQIQKLREANITNPQLAIAGALSRSSGKPIEEILKMRSEDKKGWGQIANELNVEPKTIGQSVAELHRKNNKEQREERKELRQAKKEERRLLRAEKKEARKELRAQKREKKNQ